MNSRWLVSSKVDAAAIFGLPALALAVAWRWPAAEVGALVWLLLVVGIDVAHVWSTLLRTWLDPHERRARAAELSAVPLVALVASALLCAVDVAWFWRVAAYLAAFHFVRQQAGIAALYRFRQGLPTRGPAAQAERHAHYAVTGWPLLWWHAHLPRDFAWFVQGDFVPLPGWLVPLGGAAAVVALGRHAAWRRREGPPAPRDLWLLLTAASWLSGIVLLHGDMAFTASNVVLHGVPYLALVLTVGRRQWDRLGDGPGQRRWFTGPGIVAVLIALASIALVEEALWDAPPWLAAVSTPVLAVPQLTHYVLDGRIWRLGPGRLRASLAAGTPPPSSAGPGPERR